MGDAARDGGAVEVSDDDVWAVTVATQVRVAAAAATRGVAAWRH